MYSLCFTHVGKKLIKNSSKIIKMIKETLALIADCCIATCYLPVASKRMLTGKYHLKDTEEVGVLRINLSAQRHICIVYLCKISSIHNIFF